MYPTKSKTKCVYMCGNMTSRNYPAPVQLNGRDLPFVTSATHSGQELTQASNMELDCKIKPADYIDKTVTSERIFLSLNLSRFSKQLRSTDVTTSYGAML